MKIKLEEKLKNLQQSLQQIQKQEMQAHNTAMQIVGRIAEINDTLKLIEEQENDGSPTQESEEIQEKKE